LANNFRHRFYLGFSRVTFATLAAVFVLIVGCDHASNDQATVNSVVIRQIPRDEFDPPPDPNAPPGGSVSEPQAPVRLTIAPVPGISRENLRFEVRAQNLGKTGIVWDSEFATFLTWRVRHGTRQSFDYSDSLVAISKDGRRADARLTELAPQQSITKLVNLTSLSVHTRGFAMGPDGICRGLDGFEPFRPREKFAMIRVAVEYGSDFYLWNTDQEVAPKLPRGHATSNAVEVFWP
jgi:hypothetical protein